MVQNDLQLKYIS